jgi:hypothetical protein
MKRSSLEDVKLTGQSDLLFATKTSVFLLLSIFLTVGILSGWRSDRGVVAAGRGGQV